MKKGLVFLFGIIALTLATSCEKENELHIQTPKTEVPDAFVGKWQLGNFNIANFWNYNGNLPYNSNNDGVAYNISKDGNAEQFLFYQFDDGSNRQVLAYRKGTMTYDAGTKTLRFCPQEGNFRTFKNGSKSQENYGSEDLFPNYAPRYRNCSFVKNAQRTYMVCLSDRNEQLEFVNGQW